MDKKKTPLSFHVIYWMTNIVTGLFAFVCLAAIVFYIMLWTDFFGNDLQMHVDLPGQFSVCNSGTMEYSEGIMEVELVEASGRLHLVNTPTSIARQIVLILMGVCAMFFYILFTFQRFVTRVRAGEIFTISNILRLQNISYMLVGLWFYTIIFRRLAYHYFSKNVDIENVEIVSEFNNYPWILMTALFLWVLSHILIRGLKLREEQDLTI